MGLASWLQNRKRHGTPRPRPAFRPALEALEDRCVPSTLKVINTYDDGYGSLRYEIAHAQSNDTIVFDMKKLGGRTITLISGELVISKSLTIQGPGAGLLKIISEPWSGMDFTTHYGSRFFEVDGAGTAVALSGLTLTGGGGTRVGDVGIPGSPNDGYGGAILNFGTLTLSNCTLGGYDGYGGVPPGNDAEYGGAIANFGTTTITSCDVSNNSTNGVGDQLGGGIYNAGTLTVSGGDVSSNLAGNGGGIYNAGTATVSGCTLSGNSVKFQGQGGGIYNAGTATVSGCTLSGNSAKFQGQGGGIYNAGTAAALTVLDSIFSSNSPDNIFGPYTDGGHNTFH
jgi:hypothetical protein